MSLNGLNCLSLGDKFVICNSYVTKTLLRTNSAA